MSLVSSASAHCCMASCRVANPAQQGSRFAAVQSPSASCCAPHQRLSRHRSLQTVRRQRLQQRHATDDQQEARTSADSSSDDSTSGVDTSSRAVAKAPVDPARAAARVAEEAQVAQGQRTAVITGAVSIVFGVLYLVLVQFLDSRGGEMQPPPPEAFGL